MESAEAREPPTGHKSPPAGIDFLLNNAVKQTGSGGHNVAKPNSRPPRRHLQRPEPSPSPQLQLSTGPDRHLLGLGLGLDLIG